MNSCSFMLYNYNVSVALKPAFAHFHIGGEGNIKLYCIPHFLAQYLRRTGCVLFGGFYDKLIVYLQNKVSVQLFVSQPAEHLYHAILMISAAAPCTGAFIAARLPKD